MIPDPFVGSELIPLNQMDKEGELYQSHARKYLGRESLMEEIIPKLNCKWNDVVQFSALDPQKIVNELKKIQPNISLARSKYFKISIDEVHELYSGVIFNKKVGKGRGNFKIDESEVVYLNKENYQEIYEVPELTKIFWKRAIDQGGKLLWFPYIPHILINARVETSDFEVLELTV
ncbi:hypothetical protein A9Q84_04110 [Halobacteriovorax marinus]|uniref:Uncharacterized protein n=1 Tax=Halobacteriovorax marinus TaxID=97084 RepID=A0A1Y5FAN5_9BACT|nr:hypothetical protein A9Q84_04110 [Halobacteriovorax marinus]